MAKSRLVGSYPVIGIRPTIDGRRGALDARGSLEDQTMNMAKSAAKLFEENLKYSNGEPVKLLLIPSDVLVRNACADKFRKRCRYHSYSYTMLVLELRPWIWIHRPSRLYGIQRNRETWCCISGIRSCYTCTKGLPAFGIYGHDVQKLTTHPFQEDVKEKLLKIQPKARVAMHP